MQSQINSVTLLYLSVQKYIERIRYIDSLISKRGTGSVEQLAAKLNLSRRTTLDYLREMKELGCPIKYCRKRNSYYYTEEGNVFISFFGRTSKKNK